MADNLRTDKPFYFFDRKETGEGVSLTYEIWENFCPDKIIGGEIRPYTPNILCKEQLDALIPFWKNSAKEANDPVLTLQLDKNGGSKIGYRYLDERTDAPPNTRSFVVKPIFDKKIEKMILAGEEGRSFVFHFSIKSPSLYDEVSQSGETMEEILATDMVSELLDKNSKFEPFFEKNRRNIFSNVFVFDRRLNK